MYIGIRQVHCFAKVKLHTTYHFAKADLQTTFFGHPLYFLIIVDH